MPSLVLQSSTQLALKFLLVSSTDHITGVAGLGSGPAVTISKEGSAFAAPAGAISEIGSGWYEVAANATDTNTIGEILLHATGTGADPTDIVAAQVVGWDPTAGLVVGNVNVTQWAGAPVATPNVPGVPVIDVIDWLGHAVSAIANGIPDINVKNFNGVAAVNLPSNFNLMNIDGSGNVAIQSNVKKSQASTGFMFVMTDTTNHRPLAGLGSAITAQRSIDGGSLSPTVNGVTEVGLGIYAINLAGADVGGNQIMFEFTAAGADTRCIELITDP
jgi:hypothetical protein